MQSLLDRLDGELETRKSIQAYRVLHGLTDHIDFCSNDYLGLSCEPEVQEICNEILSHYNSSGGSTGSRLISGDHPLYRETELMLADFHNSESALIFNSGYDANIGLFSTIPKRGDTILYDSLCHASIRDGIRLSHAKSYSFSHNDMSDLHSKLQKASGDIFIAIESIYSMDGDEANIDAIITLSEEFSANIIVDEAHSTGTCGINGEGLVVSRGFKSSIFARLHTFGKAMGAHGGVWVGSGSMRDYLINYSRPFIYTTALPIHSLATIQASYLYLNKNTDKIIQLQNRIKTFKTFSSQYEQINILESHSPIQSIIIPGNRWVKTVSERLQSEGFNVRAILSPTVAEGRERIRICLHSFNSAAEIKTLINELNISLEIIH